MKKQSPSTASVRAGLTVVLLLVAAFSLACRIRPETLRGSDTPATAGATVERIFGTTCTVLGNQFYETADLYFHRGVPHHHEAAFTNSLFQILGRAVRPIGHRHAHGRAVREILPWLRLATRLEPHNLEPYFVAAYWLGKNMNETNAALRVLEEAQANNPFDYRVHLEKGRLFMYEKRWRRAAEEFSAGLAFWPRPLTPDSEDARLDKRNLLLHRALLYEREGHPDKAVAAYREILDLFPDTRGIIPERIAALSAGRTPPVPAQTILENLAAKPESKYTICHRHEEEHAPGHAHEHEPRTIRPGNR